MKIILRILLVGFLLTGGCVASTSYQRAYDREMRRLEWQATKIKIKDIAHRDARIGKCISYPLDIIPITLISYYYNECEREQKRISRRNYYQEIWRERRNRWRGKYDARRDFRRRKR